VTCAVVLPGTGSDDRFVRSAFAGPLAALGVDLIAPAPRSGADVVACYREALDHAVRGSTSLLVGGISLGAHVAARWAASAPQGRLSGLLLALPAWTGPPGAAPAALAARLTAAQVREGGVPAALACVAADAPAWLAAELARAWPRHGAGLAPALEAAAAEVGPTEAELAALDVPAGVAALVDDPVHPLAVARRWQGLLPRSALVTARLAAFGDDPETIGRAAVLGWLRAAQGR
jgi:pimeloyl-ACP methyl ester carboxylesterase